MKTKNKFNATDKTKKLTIAKIERKLERKLDGYKMDIFWLLTELSQFKYGILWRKISWMIIYRFMPTNIFAYEEYIFYYRELCHAEKKNFYSPHFL